MGEPFIGEIRMVGFYFPPVGWVLCDGNLLPISENDTLFALIGTTYGGDGQTTFALPDLRGRVPIHAGTGPSGLTYTLGQPGGVESVTLTTNQIPSHTHTPAVQSGTGNNASPQNGVWASSGQGQYAAGTANAALKASLVGSAGGGQPHDNMMPYTVINFILSLYGIYPQPS